MYNTEAKSLSSIDIGFIYTKSIVDGKRIMTKSVTGDGRKLEFREFDLSEQSMDKKKEYDFIQVQSGTQRQFVSDLAIEQSNTVYHSLKDDRFQGDTIETLIRVPFAIGLGNGPHQSYIVSGLPASQFTKFKDAIKSLFMGSGQHTHNYSVDWERYLGEDHMHIEVRPQSAMGSVRTIEGRFLPQPHGAAMSRILGPDGNIADKELAAKTVAVIDPGFGTSDIYVLNSLSPVERLTFSTKVAMNTAYTLISNKINETFGVLLPLYKIERVVRTGVFVKDGRPADMRPTIQWALKITAQQLLSEIFNHWKNTHEIDHILVAGGGGKALYPFLVNELNSPELLQNSQWSIVQGYNNWGHRTWKDIRVV